MRVACRFALMGIAACGRINIDPIATDDGRRASDGPVATDTYSAAVLSDHPLAYWRLAETSGTSARDEIGSYPGTYEGTCQLGATGALQNGNPAVGFDGSTCRLNIGDALPFVGSAQFTIELWVNPSIADTTTRFIISRNTLSGADTGYQLCLQAPALWFERLGGCCYINSGPPMLDRFQFVVVTFDGTTERFFIDGNEAGSLATTAFTSPAAGALVFGDNARDVTFKFAGVLDEIAYYDHALAPARIAAHYAAR